MADVKDGGTSEGARCECCTWTQDWPHKKPHKLWTAEEWSRGLSTDETRFSLRSPMDAGKVCVRRWGERCAQRNATSPLGTVSMAALKKTICPTFCAPQCYNRWGERSAVHKWEWELQSSPPFRSLGEVRATSAAYITGSVVGNDLLFFHN